jgi:alpha-1,3-mannosyltransferase
LNHLSLSRFVKRYPAGFVYIYSALYHFTEKGADILAAQNLFLWLYLYTLIVVVAIYRTTSSVTPVAMGLLALSKRIHSIFVLRLFNDCVAMALLYTAILLFVNKRWKFGCVFYSLAVSVKMNILLFSPGLLLLLIQGHSSLFGVFQCLSICAVIQLVLAFPFLRHAPVSYLRGAFDLGRVFQVIVLRVFSTVSVSYFFSFSSYLFLITVQMDCQLEISP